MEVARYSETSEQCCPEDHRLDNIQSEISKVCNLTRYSVVTVGAVYCSSTCRRTQYRNPEDGSLVSIENDLCPLKYQPCFILQSRKSQIVHCTRIYILRRS